MGMLSALIAYGDAYLAIRPDGTRQEAREWMEQTDIEAGTAAELANKGYTPTLVAERIAAAPERYSDERDADAAIDAMLYGPDVA